jgi:hypothetical protein
MKRILCILLASFTFHGCYTDKLYRDYRLYKRDSHLNYPTEKLAIQLLNDTTGLFVNKQNEKEVFSQNFVFSKVKSDFLVVGKVRPVNRNFISLKAGDTIVIDKQRLHFFYNGDKKYLLSFKKQH